jgi:DNA-binding NarL/FixJ family response regulator
MSNPRERRRKPILRVVLVDDHPVTREGQKAVLSAEGDIRIVGEADSGEEALRVVTDTKPDIVILDLDLRGEPSGTELCRKIKALPAAPYVFIFTDYSFAGDVSTRCSAETNGYLHKRSSSEELLDAIRRVAGGEKVWETEECKGGPRSLMHAAREG